MKKVWPHLDMTVCKQVLNQGPICPGHACMMDGKAKGQQVSQVCVLARLCLCLQDLPAGLTLLAHVQRPFSASKLARHTNRCFLRLLQVRKLHKVDMHSFIQAVKAKHTTCNRQKHPCSIKDIWQENAPLHSRTYGFCCLSMQKFCKYSMCQLC